MAGQYVYPVTSDGLQCAFTGYGAHTFVASFSGGPAADGYAETAVERWKCRRCLVEVDRCGVVKFDPAKVARAALDAAAPKSGGTDGLAGSAHQAGQLVRVLEPGGDRGSGAHPA